MAEKSSSTTVNFVLPFSVASTNRKEFFTKEMEQAAIFCHAELERAKGGGIILKQASEKTVSISQMCYPFLLVPWGDLTLLFDGLATTQYTFEYEDVPNVKAFRDEVQRSSKSLENYMDFLSAKTNHFRATDSRKQITANSLVTAPDVLSEFGTYLAEARQVEALSSDAAPLSTAVDEMTVSGVAHEFTTLKAQFKEETATLYVAMKLLNKTTNSFAKTIRAAIKSTQERYAEEIRKIEATVTPKVDQLQEEYDEKIAAVTGDFEKQLLPLQKERVKLEKSVAQIRSQIERAKVEAQTSAQRKDDVSRQRWKETENGLKRELSETEARIEEVMKRTKLVEDEKNVEFLRQRSDLENRMQEAKKDLLEIEASRDAEVQNFRQQVDKLRQLTAAIITQIDSAAKMRETRIADLEKLGLQQKRETEATCYVPFYLVCYRSDSKRRYVVTVPSIVNSVGLTVKLKGALGRAKIKNLLSPRFQAITAMLNRLPLLIEQNAVLEREITEAAEQISTLKTATRENVRNGLKLLNSEGWFSEKEYESFNQALSASNG